MALKTSAKVRKSWIGKPAVWLAGALAFSANAGNCNAIRTPATTPTRPTLAVRIQPGLACLDVGSVGGIWFGMLAVPVVVERRRLFLCSLLCNGRSCSCSRFLVTQVVATDWLERFIIKLVDQRDARWNVQFNDVGI